VGLGRGAQRFHSLRRLRLLIVSTAVLLLVFVIFMASLTENYINNEFKQFDTIVMALVPLIFNDQSAYWMKLFGLFASRNILIPLIVLTILWIGLKAKDRIIEIVSLLIVVIGGEIFEEGIRRIFHHLQPVHSPLTKHILYSFPSEQTLTAFILFGFSAYLLVRHSRKSWLQTFTSIVVVIVLLLIGLSRIYFKQQYPSDVVAGYAFGGVWLSLNVLVLELFRFSRRFSKLKDAQ
jgi:membrane-associated phospholipid phosphatase